MSDLLSCVETGALVLAVAFVVTAAIDIYVRCWARDEEGKRPGEGDPPAGL